MIYLNIFEQFAMVLSIIYVITNARQHIITWLFGFLASIVYCAVFFKANLFVSSGLSALYAVLMIFGWYSWKKNSTKEKMVSFLNTKARIYVLLASVIVSGALFIGISFISSQNFPAGDSIIAGTGIVSYFLTAEKKIEAWIGWILSNSLAVLVYAMTGLTYTAVLYFIFLIMAFYGLYCWVKALKNNKAKVTSLQNK